MARASHPGGCVSRSRPGDDYPATKAVARQHVTQRGLARSSVARSQTARIGIGAFFIARSFNWGESTSARAMCRSYGSPRKMLAPSSDQTGLYDEYLKS